MTPAERALLLAVADAVAVELQVVGMPKTADEISDLIAAVEAEAAFAADDESELAEVAAKAERDEAEVCQTCDGATFTSAGHSLSDVPRLQRHWREGEDR